MGKNWILLIIPIYAKVSIKNQNSPYTKRLNSNKRVASPLFLV
ncbi:Low molecular weight protein tyrosine phosphatase [bacterium endosymbiont of Bathymodiolus sp. 5 South]|nr:Low molecular weight protein tyrosine phosphatase (EC 3.1.3.48) [uncultured Gammaproteobacteria bacterium]SHN93453.1 Low molecular weight protein tyrosine phosphatase [bacterium endosymbiont of Bathymodiolus sp. 5 South]SSC09064.1 Low molecular weight protein tyrosine phosphatase [bacterium endosymbiont of Bathymodiolus sp. 5 South]VVH55101.1 Low molecular weight protein tyrosine phosphatase (EC [uncultured Gammaproteobacteria bacterium]VVH61351.1 Low molecular weight protein tyrosine phosph